ncbi:MAG: sulfotransferase [Myxococcota bacterium]|nr:sulfotransferase [Myxococcota bacterium]
MIYVVLGMHKSGTTLVSQILHRSGVDMGDGFEVGGTYDQGNQWERREAFLVNLDLVGCKEGDYYSLDHYLDAEGPLPSGSGSQMRRMIEACEAKGGDWGFKEPLTCLTYRLWRQVLPPHKIIGVYRSPLEVINHYRAPVYRPDLVWRALRAWSNYNLGLLEAVEHAGSSGLLLRYEDLMKEEAEFARLEEFLGRPLVDVRSSGQYRAEGGHFLFNWLDPMMRIFGLAHPSAVFSRLESTRKEQSELSELETRKAEEG